VINDARKPLAEAKPAVETPAIEKPAEVDPLVDGKLLLMKNQQNQQHQQNLQSQQSL